MDIDIDWCLTCEKRVEGDSPYCSADCQDRAGPSTQPHYYYPEEDVPEYNDDDEDVIFHSIDGPSTSSRWTGSDHAGISAWAAEIPCGAPAGADSSCDSSSFYSPQGSTFRQPPPNLLKSHRRTLPPTLSMATPPSVLPPPSHPVVTPKRQPSFSSVALTGNASMGQTSLRSVATESSLVATPYSSQPVPIASASRKPSVLDGIYSQVRSWVSPAPHLASSQQKRLQTPVLRVDPSKFTSQARSTTFVNVVSSPQSSCAVSDKSATYWITGTLVMDPPLEKQSLNKTVRGRKPATELPFRHDDHPSFRTRGRKASRAAA